MLLRAPCPCCSLCFCLCWRSDHNGESWVWNFPLLLPGCSFSERFLRKALYSNFPSVYFYWWGFFFFKFVFCLFPGDNFVFSLLSLFCCRYLILTFVLSLLLCSSLLFWFWPLHFCKILFPKYACIYNLIYFVDIHTHWSDCFGRAFGDHARKHLEETYIFCGNSGMQFFYIREIRVIYLYKHCLYYHVICVTACND